MNVFFDVLDTLVDENGTPRPHSREVFLGLTGMGHDVYLWSSGGERYAARAARVLGVEDLVEGCCPKRNPPEGVAVDYAVDDDEGVVEEYGGRVVDAYRGDPEDAELSGWRKQWAGEAARDRLRVFCPPHRRREATAKVPPEHHAPRQRRRPLPRRGRSYGRLRRA